ncbi:MAG: glycosyltransferase, partial [Pseudomonadales bacterium]
HRIEAGADIFLMPSLYEPCGLNQMYSMRYGTIPVVRRTGGLKDTVNCVEQTQGDDIPTGFCFDAPTAAALTDTVARAIKMYSHEPERWQQMMKVAMDRDFGWKRSAATYLCLYEQTILESAAAN